MAELPLTVKPADIDRAFDALGIPTEWTRSVAIEPGLITVTTYRRGADGLTVMARRNAVATVVTEIPIAKPLTPAESARRAQQEIADRIDERVRTAPPADIGEGPTDPVPGA